MAQSKKLVIQQALTRAKKEIKAGNTTAAARFFQEVLRLRPNHPAAKKGLRNLRKKTESANPPPDRLKALIGFYEGGQLEKARQLGLQLKKAFPGSWMVHDILGAVLKKQGHFREALKALDAVIRLNPDHADAHLSRGAVLKTLGDLPRAVESYENAIRLRPDLAAAHNNLGVALSLLERPDAAIQAFDNAIRLKPEYAEAYNNRSGVRRLSGQLGPALEDVEKAIGLKPDYQAAYNNLGNVLYELGRSGEAVQAFDNAIRLNPALAEAYNNRGNALKASGRLADALESYEKALELMPEYAAAFRNLATLKSFEPGDPLVSRMAEQIGVKGISAEDRTHIHFGLGKAFTDAGDYEAAFRHLEAGNRLRKKALNYRFESDKALFDRIQQIFSPRALADPDLTRPAPSPKLPAHPAPPVPVFILGMPRSGTTLVEQILASHSGVYGAGELKALGNAVENVNGQSRDLAPACLEAVRSAYLADLADLGISQAFVTDKMPHNFLWIGYIAEALPEARIIHVQRDAAATCWSVFTHYFSEKGLGFAYDQKDAAAYYRLYQGLMAFWHDAYPGKIYDLNYETLTENQEPEIRRLLDHLSLDWEENCLRFHETRRQVNTASSAQVREKMYQGSSGKWKKFKPYLAPMLAELGR